MIMNRALRTGVGSGRHHIVRKAADRPAAVNPSTWAITIPFRRGIMPNQQESKRGSARNGPDGGQHHRVRAPSPCFLEASRLSVLQG